MVKPKPLVSTRKNKEMKEGDTAAPLLPAGCRSAGLPEQARGVEIESRAIGFDSGSSQCVDRWSYQRSAAGT